MEQRSIAVVFPGQGTQKPGMGAPWRAHDAWRVVARAEDALGEPLAPLLLDASAEDLGPTRHAQLAVLLTSLLAWEATRDTIPEPVAYAGHSLGQVTALVASGALPFDEGVRFTARRGEATQAAADANPGRMAALVGATIEQAQRACEAAPDECWLANDNAPGQVVIAGTPDGLDRASEHARELGVRRVVALDVAGAFHTPLLRDASDTLRAELESVALRDTNRPIVSNHDAVPYTDAKGWRERLADHVVVPVRWRDSQETLTGLGATTFVEVGHGATLAGLAKRTVPDVAVVGVATPADLEQLEGGS
ncbi:MAG: ACP S-malonyltransferase [Acidimicrobiia bacterium]